MKIEIWSDIMCPFCYIGKRKFENALTQFAHKDGVEVVWHSFQLQPDLQSIPGKHVTDFLAETKGMSREQAAQLNAHVTKMAREVDLHYDFDKAVVANTFDAHRLIHLAAQHGLQNEAEERLFSAYFIEGKDVGDSETLVQLGTAIGLNPAEVREVLQSGAFANDVQADIQEAQELGISGVPFFVLNRKYGISGAQPTDVFLQALQQIWNEDHPDRMTSGT